MTAEELLGEGVVSGRLIAYYLAEVQRTWEAMGFPHELLRFREVGDDEKPFYSKETWDFEVLSDQLGWVELAANNYRMDYDLGGHQKGSKADLRWTAEDGRKFIPHVWEISAGLDRTLMCLIEVAWRQDDSRKYPYLSLPPQISPSLCAVFPLVRKDGLPSLARTIVDDLRIHGINSTYDESGSIGRRYARVDEIGCPFAVTVDYSTSEKAVVTLRDRDSTEQATVKVEELPDTIWKLYNGLVPFSSLLP